MLVDDEEVGAIGPGLCLFVGVTHDDDESVARAMAAKVWTLRVFDDGTGAANLSLADATTPSSVLVVSQFTLYGDTTRGRRPSWIAAARPEVAEPLITIVAEDLERQGATVATGRFRAHMHVSLVNDGPVTLLLELTRRP